MKSSAYGSFSWLVVVTLSAFAQQPQPAPPATPAPVVVPSGAVPFPVSADRFHSAAAIMSSFTSDDSTSSGTSSLLPDLFTGTVGTEVNVQVPQGRHGMQPNVDLLYRSNASNGVLGVGWSLDLGSIERNTQFGIDYGNDKYVYRTRGGAIDLTKTGENEYRASIEQQFRRFQLSRNADGSLVWVVTDKSGRTQRFGSTAGTRQTDPADPTKTAKWYLDRVEDLHHNFMEFKYEAHDGQIYPSEIDYAGGVQLPPTNKVIFNYEPRVDIEQSFSPGFSVNTKFRLQGISVVADGTPIRSYTLKYGTSATTYRSVLTEVDTTSGDGAKRYPPITFEYESAPGWVTHPGDNGPTPGPPVYNQCLSGSFIGDGKTDLACFTGTAGQWHVVTLTAAGWTALPGGNGPTPGIPVGNQCIAGDYNGDGKTDLACFTGAAGQWHVVTLTAAGWTTLPGGNGPTPGIPVGNQCIAGDYNGDGKTDLACFTGTAGQWHVVTLTAAGWTTLPGGNGPTPGIPVGNQCIAGDYNGDGKTDLACFTGTAGQWHVVTLTAAGWTALPGGNGPTPGIPVGNQCIAGDYNGDGRTDLACFTGTAGQWHVVTLTAAGWTTLPGGNGPTPGIPVGNQCITGDFNGDGKTDLACFTGTAGQWHVVTLNASGWTALPGSGGPTPGIPIYNQCLTGDFVGSGKTDINCFTLQPGKWHLVSDGNVGTDLLSAMVDGSGGKAIIKYVSSSTFPNTALPFAVTVLSSITNDDGRGNLSTTTFTYAGGLFSTSEREFRGFSSVRTTGPGNGQPGSQKIEEVFFHQGSETEPVADGIESRTTAANMKGKPYRVRLLDDSGHVYSEVVTHYKAGTNIPYFNPPTEIDTYACDSGTCGKELKTTFEYDSFGSITKETHFGDPSTKTSARTIVRSYSNNEQSWLSGLLLSESIFSGITTQSLLSKVDYFYDGDPTCNSDPADIAPRLGDLTGVRPWTGSDDNVVTSVTGYDSFGNVSCKKDSAGNISRFEYDRSSSTYLTAITNALQQKTRRAYYGVDGIPSSGGFYGSLKFVTDPNGARTLYEYDSLGRAIKETKPDGSWTSVTFNDLGLPATQNIRTDTAGGISSWTYFDGMGRAYLKKSTGPSQTKIAVEWHYDAQGRLSSTSLPYIEGSAKPLFTETTYDVLDRPVRIKGPDGVLGRSCYSDWTTVSLDGNNHRIRRVTDGYGHLISVDEYDGIFPDSCSTDQDIAGTPNATPVIRHRTTYDIDDRGNLVQVTDPKGNVTKTTYDHLNRKISVSDSDSGTTVFSYDGNGNVVSQVSASGKSVYFQYDALNRIIQKDYGRRKRLGSGDVVRKYDTGGVYGIGRLAQSRSSGAVKSFGYDSAGRLVSESRSIGTHTFLNRYTYDLGNKLRTITYTSGDVVSYEYDGPFLDSVHDGKTIFAYFSDYDAFGNPKVVHFGNGTTTTYSYGTGLDSKCASNDARLCSMVSADDDGTVFASRMYKYDLAGNVISAQTDDQTSTYVYDERNRLLAVGSAPKETFENFKGIQLDHPDENVLDTLHDHYPAISWKEGYAYDEIGNIEWSSRSGDYSYGSSRVSHSPTKVGRVSYSYDRDGNMTSAGARSMSYDAEGRLANVTSGTLSTDFSYDGDGERTKVEIAGASILYGGDLEECRSERCSRYIKAGEQIIARVDKPGAAVYYVLDRQLSVIAQTDQSGRLIQAFTYGPFGNLQASLKGAPQGHGYTSQRFDNSTGLYFYQSRYYDPVIGRFIQPDAFMPEPSDPQNLNRYTYALNNPASLSDPDGHCPICIAIIVGAIIGGAQAAITHHNVLEGVARGAIFGAVTGGAGVLVNGAGTFAQIAAQTAAGSAASSANAMIFGGDVGQAALFGAAFGAAGGLGNAAHIEPFNAEGTGILAAGGGIGNELATAGLEGAVIGGAYAGFTGGNVLQGAQSGATDWVIGELQNMAIGHGFGLLASGFGAPRWEKGAFKYDVSWMSSATSKGWITFGNVISGSATGLDDPISGGMAGTFRDHEMGHVRQSTLYGRYYPLAAAFSLVQGAGWALAKTYWTNENVPAGAHNYGLLERADNPYPMPIRGKDPE